MVYYILLSIVYLQYIFHHISPYFTIFHHISPYFIIFHHISPYFTIFHHISPYFTIFFLASHFSIPFWVVQVSWCLAPAFSSPRTPLWPRQRWCCCRCCWWPSPSTARAQTCRVDGCRSWAPRVPRVPQAQPPPWWLGIFVVFFLGNEPPNSMIWTGKLLYHVVNACFLTN